jgi:CRISPR type III-A-associated RAMP protein Csm5
MKAISNSFFLRIETVTPVHIGNGDTYVPGYDYEAAGGQLKFIDQGLFFRQIAGLSDGEKRAIAKALETGKVLDLIFRNPRFAGVILYETPKPNPEPQDYKKQVREGSGLPLLPGSSLKGSLVTALLSHWAQQDGNKLKSAVNQILSPKWDKSPKYAGDDLLKGWLGKDPNHSLMRLLRVGDIAFYQAETRPLIARVTRLQQPKTKFQQKSFAMGIEALLPGSVGLGRIDFDQFLAPYCSDQYGFPNGANLSLQLLFQALKERTRCLLQSEIDFLQNMQGDHQAVLLRTAQQLLERQQQYNAKTTLLPVGWGIGWRGMTGQLIEQELHGPQGKALRTKLKLAVKHLDYPFPKSRRVAMTEKGPMPLGWIELGQIASGEYADQQRQLLEKRRQHLHVLENIGVTKVTPAANQEAQTEEELRSFERTLPKTDKLPSEVDTLISRFEGLQGEKIRELCREKLKERYAKEITKGVKKGKGWAKRLADILDEA